MFIVLVIAGFLAGILGGLLGLGGGILIMPILRFFLNLSPVYSAGVCITAVFFTSIGGSFRHYRQGNINLKSIIPIIVGGGVSTLIFSFVFLYFIERTKWLDIGTGIVFSLVAIRMIIVGLSDVLRRKVNDFKKSGIRGRAFTKFVIGIVGGIMPGLLGIGTGAILVPIFVFLLNAPMKIAIGTSLACFSVNAFLSSILKFFQGFIILDYAIPLCIGTFIGANIGARLSARFPSPLLKIVFGLVFIYVAVKYYLLFLGGK